MATNTRTSPNRTAARRVVPARWVASLLVAVIGTLLASISPAAALDANERTVRVEGVDLYNGMTYRVQGVDVTVRNGRGTLSFPWRDDDTDFTILGHLYGDLSGDGLVDAAVWASYESDVAGRIVDAIWVVPNVAVADPVASTSTWSGAGAFGGLEYVEIHDGYLSVSTFGGTDVCCPTTLSTTRWVMNGSGLAAIERFAPVSYLDLSGVSSDSIPLLTFAPDTSSAVVEAHPTTGSQKVRFDANAGQSVQFRNRWGNADVRISRADTGAVVGTLRHNQDVNVPVDGRYLAEVLTSPETSRQASFELTIADRRGLYHPTWSPRTYSDDSLADISALWPELTSAHPGVDIDKVNDVIRSVVDDEIASFRRATRHQEHAENQDSGLWINYRLTLAAYDLISVDMTVGRRVCCDDGVAQHTVDRHTVTIDLNRGRRIGLDELVGDDLRPELAKAWWHAVTTDTPYLVDNGYVVEPDADHEWIGAVVHPQGVTIFGTGDDGFDVAGLLTWDRLADLDATDATAIAHQLERRASSAIRVPSPLDECGC